MQVNMLEERERGMAEEHHRLLERVQDMTRTRGAEAQRANSEFLHAQVEGPRVRGEGGAWGGLPLNKSAPVEGGGGVPDHPTPPSQTPLPLYVIGPNFAPGLRPIKFFLWRLRCESV